MGREKKDKKVKKRFGGKRKVATFAARFGEEVVEGTVRGNKKAEADEELAKRDGSSLT